MKKKINPRTHIVNKKVNFNYEEIATFTAGIKLEGCEIKSIRLGKVAIVDSYCIIKGNELHCLNMTIEPYEQRDATDSKINPRRERVLLLTKKELKDIKSKLISAGIALLVRTIFINEKGLCKIGLVLGKGKNQRDKRETIKKRDAERELR